MNMFIGYEHVHTIRVLIMNMDNHSLEHVHIRVLIMWTIIALNMFI